MYVYGIEGEISNASSASADTVDAYMALRETAQAVWLQTWLSQGKGAALTALTGMIHRLRHWTTVGTGGDSVTPSPARPGMPAASTLVVDGGYTEGTVSGATVLAFGHGATGPGGWMARNDESRKVLEAGSVDEWSMNSIQPGTVALNFEDFAEICE